MNIEIIEIPLHFHLHGISGVVVDQRFAETGLRLMNEMWRIVKGANLTNSGINHWVYLGEGRMFVGVELREMEAAAVPDPLEPLEIVLPRYLKHMHVGPYQALPQKWKALTAELESRGEKVRFPSLEVYGHHCEDSSRQETTILLSLEPKPQIATVTIDRTAFESIYAGQPRWEIGRPQQAFLNAADKITGKILDSGCGTGENAFFFAARGNVVTGIDFLPEPIAIAKRKAAERGQAVTFLEMDALALKDWSERFDNVIDSGLFHVFSDEDRQRYVEGLATILHAGGRFFFLCFSDEEPGTQGPRRVSQKEIAAAFADGWVVESIKLSHYEVRPDPNDSSFSEGGPKAWFVVVRKERS